MFISTTPLEFVEQLGVEKDIMEEEETVKHPCDDVVEAIFLEDNNDVHDYGGFGKNMGKLYEICCVRNYCAHKSSEVQKKALLMTRVRTTKDEYKNYFKRQ